MTLCTRIDGKFQGASAYLRRWGGTQLSLPSLVAISMLLTLHLCGLFNVAMQSAAISRPFDLWQDSRLAKYPTCDHQIPMDQRRGYYDLPSLLRRVTQGNCTASAAGVTFYNARNWPAAIALYRKALETRNGRAGYCDHLLRLSLCYTQLGAAETAQMCANEALKCGCPVEFAYHLAKFHESRGDDQEALHYYKLACQVPDAAPALRQELQTVARTRLRPQQYSSEYMRGLGHLQSLLDDGHMADDTEAQLHWEIVGRAQPLLDGGRELFRREGIFEDQGQYYYATPSILPTIPLPTIKSPPSDHIILVRLLNYRIDTKGRYYREYLPANDTTGNLRSSAVLFLHHEDLNPRELIIDDGHFERTPYRFVGTEDPRLFRDASGQIWVIWTSWEYAKHVGEGSRAVLGRLDVPTATVQVEQVFSSPSDRFVEKNWVMFQAPGGPLQCVYEWYPLRIGTFQGNSQIGLSDPTSTPRSFQHIRGSSNGVYVLGELWFLVHGTTWHKGPGPVYYHRFAVFDSKTMILKRYTYPFKLESAEASVEYSLGITIDPKTRRITIAYSVYDATAVLREIDLWNVEQLMISADKKRKH